jgi:hypothetical protein
MWRRACLGVHDDVVTLFLMWTAALFDVLLLGASVRGWLWGLAATSVTGILLQAAYWWRRRRWDRFIRRESAQGTAAAEALLGRRVE